MFEILSDLLLGIKIDERDKSSPSFGVIPLIYSYYFFILLKLSEMCQHLSTIHADNSHNIYQENFHLVKQQLKVFERSHYF